MSSHMNGMIISFFSRENHDFGKKPGTTDRFNLDLRGLMF